MYEEFISQYQPVSRPVKSVFITSLALLSACAITPDVAPSKSKSSGISYQVVKSCRLHLPNAHDAVTDDSSAPVCASTVNTDMTKFLSLTMTGSISGNFNDTKALSGASNCEAGRCTIQFSDRSLTADTQGKDSLVISIE